MNLLARRILLSKQPRTNLFCTNHSSYNSNYHLNSTSTSTFNKCFQLNAYRSNHFCYQGLDVDYLFLIDLIIYFEGSQKFSDDSRFKFHFKSFGTDTKSAEEVITEKSSGGFDLKRLGLWLFFLFPATTCGLGVWQIFRWQQKEEMLSSIKKNETLPPVPFPEDLKSGHSIFISFLILFILDIKFLKMSSKLSCGKNLVKTTQLFFVFLHFHSFIFWILL